MANPWFNNEVQFARLLAEIMAVGLTREQLADLSESMDLSANMIDELFTRAEIVWEEAKAKEGL